MPDINQMLGSTPEQTGTENPLQKLDEASKEKIKEKKPSTDKTLDKNSIVEMLMTGDNSTGMFEPTMSKEDSKDLHEKTAKEAEVKVKDDITPKGKYIKEFKNDLLKNPEGYKVMTPRGEMTVAEAVKKGYNPITKRFEKEHDQDEIKNKHLEGLNPADRTRLEEFTNPSSAKVAKKDAAKYNLKEDSPMVQADNANEPPVQQAEPTITSADPGELGLPPTSEEPNINNMLGGAA